MPTPTLADAMQEIERLHARLRKAETALAWYADTDSYDLSRPVWPLGASGELGIVHDNGAYARYALVQLDSDGKPMMPPAEWAKGSSMYVMEYCRNAWPLDDGRGAA